MPHAAQLWLYSTPNTQAFRTQTRGTAACDDHEAPKPATRRKRWTARVSKGDGGLLFRGFLGGGTRQQGSSKGLYLSKQHTSAFPATTQHEGARGGGIGAKQTSQI